MKRIALKQFILIFTSMLTCSCLFFGILLIGSPSVQAGLLHDAILVSDSGTTNNTISQGNTSRNLAVGSDGTIYVVYHGDNGIRVAKSTNRGQNFSSSVQVSSNNYEAEIAVSSTGTVYVAWLEGGVAKVSKSTDNGSSFLAPVSAGAAGPNGLGNSSVHMATDGEYLYLIDLPGTHFIYSSDSGESFDTYDLGEEYYFSDVHVDSMSRKVIVQKDNPSIRYYISSDYGQTFATPVNPGVSVSYSVGAVSGTSDSMYLFIAGAGPTGYKINLNTGTAESNNNFGNNTSTQGRSLSADGYGNVIAGYTNSGNLNFVVSNDWGSAFGTATTVSQGTIACAAINTTNGDIMFAYEKDGVIYLNVYDNLTVGYSLNLTQSSVSFPDVGNGSTSDYVTITGTNSGGSTINISGMEIAGDFTYTTDCDNVISPAESFDINIRFEPSALGTRSGTLSINSDDPGSPRIIQLSGTSVEPAETPPTVTTQAITNIDITTATGNGNITDLGSAAVTQHGVCWGTSENPTTDNNKTEQGTVSETGAFTSSITGLNAGTTYHVRAYATSTAGTSYGGDVSFTALHADVATDGGGDGNWSTPGTWQYDLVPIAGQNVTISNDVTLDTSPTVNSLTIDSGKSLACGSYIMTVNGASDINGTLAISTGSYTANGSFDASGGNVTFTGAGTLNLAGTIACGGLGTFTKATGCTVDYKLNGAQSVSAVDYYHLKLSTGGTKTLCGHLTVANSAGIDGNLTIASDVTFDVDSTNDYGIEIGGNWTNSGIFTCREGTVAFTGSGDSTMASGGSSFYGLTMNKADGEVTTKLSPSADLTVSNILTITKGTFDLDISDVNISLGGALSIGANGRWTKSSNNDNTVTFTGAGCTITDSSSPVQDLGHVKVE